MADASDKIHAKAVMVPDVEHREVDAKASEMPLTAKTTKEATNDPRVYGTVKFEQDRKGGAVHITGELYGLAEGEHGFHVHAFGDTSTGCTSAGPHFNPTNVDHAGPDDKTRHVGDLGNIKADKHGVAKIDIKDKHIQLSGDHSVVGRCIVVHVKKDDLGKGGDDESLKTGNAGARLACAIIGLYKPEEKKKPDEK